MRRWLSRPIAERAAAVLLMTVLVGLGVASVELPRVLGPRVAVHPTVSVSESVSPSPSPEPTPSPSPEAPPTPTPQPPPATRPPAPPPACAAAPGGFPASGVLAVGTPTAMAWAPDGRLFFTDRGGTIYVYQGGQSKVFATVPTVTTEPGGGYSERGLLGLALSPSFSQDHHVYAFYSLPDYQNQAVVRWTDCGGTGTGAARLVTLPSGSDCCHKG